MSACEGFDKPLVLLSGPMLQAGLFLVPISGPHLVQQRLWHVLSCMWEGAYKIPLAADQKEPMS